MNMDSTAGVPHSKSQLLRLGHSPDPDDAFMFYGLATGKLPSGRYHFEHILQDIQTLNERATRGELEITAVSLHAYPYIHDRYALMACGCSMGEDYGPMVVAKRRMDVEELKKVRIAIPGKLTTAFLTLQLLLGKDLDTVVVPFDQILDYVQRRNADAGLIIHEGQLTYQNNGLVCCVDLGAWWLKKTGLPLPLGVNVIRRDLGDEVMREVTAILKASIAYSLEHRDAAIRHALQYARDMNTQLADRFVGMYVNHWTLDFGPRGREAVRAILDAGSHAGLVPACETVEFVG
ncbi:MAG: MqnA/MqnD/SBP family protein [Phycisphaerae bacterium]